MTARLEKTGVLLLALFLAIGTFKSQVPGYMGKRLVVGYGLYIHPAFSSITMGYADNPINVQNELFLEYTTGKKFALGLSARIYRYRYLNVDRVDAESAGGTYSQLDRNPKGSYLIQGRNFQFYGKFYKRDYLAPWGKYFLLGLTLNRYITTYDPDEMKILIEYNFSGLPNSNQRSYYDNFGPTTQVYQNVDLFFGNGHSRIFGNKIVLDYGYTIGVISMARMFSSALDYYNDMEPDKYIETTSLRRVSALNRFNFFVKLGYLF